MPHDTRRNPLELLAFSPPAVAVAACMLLAANASAVLRWAAAPLAFGLAFHIIVPGMPGMQGQASSGAVFILLLMGLVLLWIRAPLEVRLYRKAALDEDPPGPYGLELTAPRTRAYLWMYCRAGAMLIALFCAAVILVAMLTAMTAGPAGGGPTPEMMAAPGPALAAISLIAAIYIFFAPRLIVAFAETAAGTPGTLLGRNDTLIRLALRARWRMVGVMAIIWTPEHALNLLNHFSSPALPWLDALASQWWWGAANYLVGFTTMLASCTAAGLMYRLLARAAQAAGENGS